MDPGLIAKQLEKYFNREYVEMIFSYKGIPSPDTIQFILQLVESKLQIIEKNSKAKKKIVNILIEVLQNVLHHRDDFVTLDQDSFIFLLCRTGKSYQIVSGNYIYKEKADIITERIQNYISLSENELKEAYREILGNSHLSEGGGASLGLMDIIRKSGGNVEHRFIPAGGNHLFFLVEISVKTEQYE